MHPRLSGDVPFPCVQSVSRSRAEWLISSVESGRASSSATGEGREGWTLSEIVAQGYIHGMGGSWLGPVPGLVREPDRARARECHAQRGAAAAVRATAPGSLQPPHRDVPAFAHAGAQDT